MLKSINFQHFALIFVLVVTTPMLGCTRSIEGGNAAHINVQLGLAFLDKNDMSQAKKKLLAAKMAAPKDPVVWYGMGYFLERTGNIQAAEQHYRHAISLRANSGAAHNNYGTFLCRQARYQEALKEFERATQDPHYLEPAIAYANAGVCALKIPNVRQARVYFQHALANDSSFDISRYYKQDG